MQYIAQWMCDYNLYGCAYLEVRRAKFRGPVPDYLEINNVEHEWHDRSIRKEDISDEFELPKQSHCAIEIDVCAEDIMNRHAIQPRDLHYDFVEREMATSEEKLVHSMAGLWKDETRRRKLRLGLKDEESTPFPPEVLVTVSADPRNDDPGGWIHEEEFREKAASIAKEERLRDGDSIVEFDGYVKKKRFEDSVQTALQSVEDFYRKEEYLFQTQAQPGNGDLNLMAEDVQIDEKGILSLLSQDFGSDSEDGEFSAFRRNDDAESSSTLRQDIHAKAEPESEQRPDGKAYSNLFQADNQLGPSTTRTPVVPRTRTLDDIGVRKIGDFPDDDDRFDVPEDFISDLRDVAALHDSGRSPPAKKRKVEIGIPSAQKSHDLKSTSSQDSLSNGQSSSQSTARPPNGQQSSQQHTLSFPVVKDPQDPSTIFRLSQSSSSPEKKLDVLTQKSPSKSKSSSGKSTTEQSSSLSSHEIAPSPIQSLSHKLYMSFPISSNSKCLIYTKLPPLINDLDASLLTHNLPATIYQKAYYSNETDVPDRPRDYAGREFRLESDTVPFLPDFDPKGTSAATMGMKAPIVIDAAAKEKEDRRVRQTCKIRKWEFAKPLPAYGDVVEWLEKEKDSLYHERKRGIGNSRAQSRTEKRSTKHLSQIEGATQTNKHGWKYSQNKTSTTSAPQDATYMSVMSVEVHVNTRGTFVGDPEHDEIAAIFWCIQSEDDEIESNSFGENMRVGVVALDDGAEIGKKISGIVSADVEVEVTELDLLTKIVDIVRFYDPDILTGYEVHNGSWGYLIERARFKYEYDLCDDLSRTKSQSHGRIGKDADRWGFNTTSTIRVTGRHMINIWRAMRGELNLLQYTMENVVFHLLHRRIPHYSYEVLTKWFLSGKTRDLAKVIRHFVNRTQLDLQILDANELISRTSEQARLLGIDFFAVFARGSQFKVENLMFRIAKPENFMLISPSRKQVGEQNALECLPLVMEPQSDFYTSPLLVLDFQSLYPSVMIAYNYCYSTFLGRVQPWRGENKMGFTDYQRSPRVLELLDGHINYAPNGIMYLKPSIRKSLLAKMLGEILETRVMVKSGMKEDRDDKALQRLLNNRQLALKLIANVTYGYTSASFSGRMPCSEIADSIVQTGRETLEKAIALIHSRADWNAQVVYGDTDSLFVSLPGRTKDQAFDIGAAIAKAVTDANPRPVKLKFEKVYHPCVLLAKKRYVGYKYESRDQITPDFDAKGIETVRRDGTPAEQKIEEKALKVLFETADLSQVKSYFQAQCTKIMKGKVSIQDFCFAREVKLGTYSTNPASGPPPPGALISARKMLIDPRAEPQYGERVPYVVVSGAPGARLVDRCVSPEMLLRNPSLDLDAEYYITKNLIPPLERIFNLVGANVRGWWDEMPKVVRVRNVDVGDGSVGGANGNAMMRSGAMKKTLESYLRPSTCLLCRTKIPPPPHSSLSSTTVPSPLSNPPPPLCATHLSPPNLPQTLHTLASRLMQSERKVADITAVCKSCAGLDPVDEVQCDSLDCGVYYRRVKVVKEERGVGGETGRAVEWVEKMGMKALEW